MDTYTLYGEPGAGSMIVEAALALAGAPVQNVDLGWEDLGWGSKILADLNPLGQVPTLVMPDGQVMTESAAILLHLADRFPAAGLAPGTDHPARPAFLRWLTFLIAAVYPTFTYGDVPERWVAGDEAAARKLRHGTDAHRKTLWLYLETVAGQPWFLGETFSAIDLYLWRMRGWRPGVEWFREQCPRLQAIGERTAQLPAVAAVQERNFPQSPHPSLL
jgi:GST-like protein